MIEALRQLGQVEVVVINFFWPGESKPPERVDTLLDGVSVIELNLTVKGWLGRPRFDLPSAYVTGVVAQHVDFTSYDVIVSRYVKPALKLKLPPRVPVVVDFDDAVFHPPWGTLATLKMKVGALLRLVNDRLIVRGRLRLGGLNHRHYFFCREAERQAFPWLPGSVLPNLPAAAQREGAVPVFAQPDTPGLMFIGLLDYLPNQDAVDWFLDAIWPKVLEKVPQARFLVVGKGSPEKCRAWSAQPNVEVLGFVESLADAYARVTASVVPMRGGAGTNIKALEAYQYGRPVVATRHVIDAFAPLFRDGIDMLASDSDARIAEFCIDLLQHPDRAEAMARSGHARMREHLNPARFNQIVREVMEKLG
ncbi:glycosyltransferase [uncultured Aquabacterium sp.]|uniref:glycosyltransferase n=1 Tax=uncultured Aquabacterium sp. TaxID=158753 RepID=UPI0025E6BE39|nr:glycosyltransferase [uncultured Aquabacterium sp.]